jgi:two-component system cell cycle sensor histidine kinase/response regulator CckA
VAGAKLAEQMASHRPLMKVSFVSGYAENTALRRGAIDVTKSFLQKPYSLNTLAGKTLEILENEPSAIVSSASAG